MVRLSLGSMCDVATHLEISLLSALILPTCMSSHTSPRFTHQPTEHGPVVLGCFRHVATLKWCCSIARCGVFWRGDGRGSGTVWVWLEGSGSCSYSNMLMFWCPHKNLLLSAVGTCEGLHDSSMRNSHRKTVMQVLCCVVVRELWLSCRIISRARSFRMRMAPLTILACPVHCCRLSSHWGAASRSHVEWRTLTTQTPSWSSWTVPMSPALGEFFHP